MGFTADSALNGWGAAGENVLVEAEHDYQHQIYNCSTLSNKTNCVHFKFEIGTQ